MSNAFVLHEEYALSDRATLGQEAFILLSWGHVTNGIITHNVIDLLVVGMIFYTWVKGQS